MAVLLDNMQLVEWLWHDADVYFLRVDWADNGEMGVSLRCEINPEEDRQTLFDLGIIEPIIDIEFRDVWWLETKIIGLGSGREVVIDWDVVHESAIINQIRTYGVSANANLLHHKIKFNSGSNIDVVFTQIWLNEVK